MKIRCSYTKLKGIDDLTINPKNRNIHNAEQINALAKIIKRNGQRSPIVVSNRSGFIVKGHARLEAIKQLGWKKCAVDYQDYENEAEEYRDLIADNEIARHSEFNKQSFLEDIEEFKISDIDFEEFGLINFKLPELNEDTYEGKNTEISIDTYGDDLEHTCPKCNFKFNHKKTKITKNEK